jgi:hypothetical protein
VRFHTVDYRKDRDSGSRALVNRGFWFFGLPRPLLACRLLGHKPVVDGTEGFNGRPGARWVCCDRCGVRREPQGRLDPDVWGIGDPIRPDATAFGPGTIRPGRWPSRPEGTIGGQLIIGGPPRLSVEAKVGNAGSEHVLAAHVSLPIVGALYLHSEQFGTWLQRRLNPIGYESRVTSLNVHGGRVYWRLWALRDSGNRGSWRDGSVRIDPRDIALGERRYSYEDVPDASAVPVTIVLPDGDMHTVEMTLQRQVFGRARSRKNLSWTVSCESKAGISYRPASWKDGLTGWSVTVSDAAVEAGFWHKEAIAETIVKVTGMRLRYAWKPPVTAV